MKLLREASDRFPMRLLAYCLMSNHFHLVLWPSASRRKNEDRPRAEFAALFPELASPPGARLSEHDLEAIRLCINRGRSFESVSWRDDIAERLGLESTLRPRGRPKKDGT